MDDYYRIILIQFAPIPIPSFEGEGFLVLLCHKAIKGCSARQNRAKKRSLRFVNEHFEPDFNAAMRPLAFCDTVRLERCLNYQAASSMSVVRRFCAPATLRAVPLY